MGNGCCEKCGGELIGDGYSSPLRCEYAELDFGEPDGQVITCNFEEEEETGGTDV